MEVLTQPEGILLLCLFFCFLGIIVGGLFVLSSTNRIPKKQKEAFHLFLDQKEEKRRELAKQAETLKNNY